MAAILVSQGSYSRNNDLLNQAKTMENLGFSNSVSRLETPTCNNLTITCKPFQFQIKVQQTESPSRLGINGRPAKMVPPASKVARRKTTVNGKVAQNVNGKRRNIHGKASTVKRNAMSSVVKRPKNGDSGESPPVEDLKLLPSDESFSWANENYSYWQRSVDVWSFVLSLRIRVLLDNAKWAYAGGFSEDKQKSRRRKTALWLRERVLQLGPTFIKLGQLSSTRSDLFPREFVDELAKLQDRVPAFSPEKARRFIETELGAPVDQLFRKFEDQPIAAASLGQVHRAILHNGEKVVVKVQRPGLKKLFDIDFRNLKLIAEYFQKSETFGSASRDWLEIYEECSTTLYQEIDYINEGKNADKFRRDFRNIKWVRVPLVYWDYTAMKVLTLEYVPGIKINELNALDSRGYSRARISSIAIEAYLIQDLFAIVQDQPFWFPSTFTFVLKAFSSLEGIGYTLDPDFSFAKIAAPYAKELLDLRQRQQRETQLVEQIRKQADDVRSMTMSMPARVQRIEEFVEELEAGDLKLRVRVLESERAARKATVLQMATIYTVLGGTLLNLGVIVGSQGSQFMASGSLLGAGVFIALLASSMQRVKKLEKFEKMI